MIIRNNTIFFKSNDKFYHKEKQGMKPNTVRFFHDLTELKDMINFHAEFLEEPKFIQIQNSMAPHQYFKRCIIDISQFPDMWCWIFSWGHDEE